MTDYVPGYPDEPSAEIVPIHRLTQETVSEARQAVAIAEQLKCVAIRYTQPEQWTDFGGKPYLDEKGCMRFAEVYGVEFFDTRVEIERDDDDRGPFRNYNVTLKAKWRGRIVEADGGRSTKDQFWNGTEPNPNDPEKKRVRRLPLSEIDTSRVRRAAVTNAKARGTKAVLALSFTWEEVLRELKAAGKDISVIRGVDFKGKSGAAKAASGRGEMTKEKAEIRRMLIDIARVDLPPDASKEDVAAKCREFLVMFTKWTDKKTGEEVAGKERVEDLTNKQAPIVLRKVKKEYDLLMGESDEDGVA